MEAAGFLYYSPDPQGRQQKQHGHHGHFLAQPNAAYTISASPQLLAPTPIHFPSQLVLGGRGVPLTITPSASPSLMEPYRDMCSESATTDLLFNPATPPLTHSAVSTPSLSYAMPTPISNHGWSSEEPVIATVSLSDIHLPSTPADYFPPGLVAPSILKSNASPPPSISLNDLHCPALSPCSSQDSFNESDCCDPRELTIQSPTPVEIKPDILFPPMASLSGDDDQFLFGGNVESFLPLASKVTPYMAGDYNEELSDLGDSEDDFIQNFSESVFSNKRMRFDDDSENEQLPSPPMSTSSSRQGSVAPIKVLKRKLLKVKKEDTPEEMSEEQRLRSFKFGSIDSACSSEPSSPCSEKHSHMVGHPISPHVIRRGRKQSLTEDPSKTFVCHLCTRRFRRQEHLKRHFRSLHTEDKPFACGECGKKFSRSDNLTQHSRIHGTGAVVLGVLTEGEVPVLGSQFMEDESMHSPQPFIVVDSMTAASGEIKDKSSDDKKSRKKRKRSDE
ncbi:hypothetical protein AOL_s00076g216 [Orbilia oligospora ATCC 24927]|uniref:C2H2-type transcription factor MSN2 n=2 Tax=Orbilia oligospora TaxID=2813651 RepID=MSN2_ARTOA|nr:hypothetical protein AOL_s00076g216 [Orbilia oligospora ATCC 24927]EGX50251.1 hypothetical protein AOL_s00076g216 [Orbilia oligospora ATCC 24927]KAF3277730.1 hypothetical protein TWF970_004983 [Orbilia oligospora]KAF3277731.1 hypothetical protein TWF970_004983 [Orbilia oligospora]